ncbi:MAG: hypothetical protein ABSG05_00975 [Candidatus Pacearchaeota archaeon]
MKSKKGLSAVVETMIMIALVIAAVSIIWVVINNTINTQLNTASSCANVVDKVTIDQRYTCYNESSDQLRLAINVGDIKNLQDILVSITQGGQSKSFKINTDNATDGLKYFNWSGPMQIPGPNSGLTYIYPMNSPIVQFPDQVEIAPIINGNTCTGPAPITQIDSCTLLASG